MSWSGLYPVTWLTCHENPALALIGPNWVTWSVSWLPLADTIDVSWEVMTRIDGGGDPQHCQLYLSRHAQTGRRLASPTVLYCTVLYCTVVYWSGPVNCNVLNCTIIYLHYSSELFMITLNSKFASSLWRCPAKVIIDMLNVVEWLSSSSCNHPPLLLYDTKVFFSVTRGRVGYQVNPLSILSFQFILIII